MLIGGLWHGAAWKFVFWGAMHGVGLAVHKATAPVVAKVPDNRVTRTLWWTVTMVYVSLLWTFFRASSWTDSVLIIENIFSNFSADYILPFLSARWMWTVMMVAVIAVHAMPSRMVDAAGRWFVRTNWLVKLLIFIVVVQLVIQFKGEDVAPFIYFQF